MTLFRMPIFVWTVLVTSVLVVLATPVLTSALIMLFIDRNYGGSFFDPAHGGNAILWQNVFWFYSHPAVYIMVLPAMGIVSEILPVFTPQAAVRLQGVRLRDGRDRRPRLLGLGPPHVHDGRGLPAVLQLHDVPHRGPDRGQDVQLDLAPCAAASSRSRRRCCSPSASCSMFLIGGINGAFSAAVPVDFALQDTYWVVAHLHYVLFGGSVFGVFAGLYYWFPKMTGRMLNETLGKIQFVLMFIGFNLTFFPMHLLGLDGHAPADRRLRVDRRLERPEPARDDRRLHDRARA